MRSLNPALIRVTLCLEGPHLPPLCCEKTLYLPWLCAHHNPHASYAYWIPAHGESAWKQEEPCILPLRTFFMAVLQARKLYSFVKTRLNVYNRRSRDFAVTVAGEEQICITALVWHFQRPCLSLEKSQYLAQIHLRLYADGLFYYSFPCTKQVSKTKQNEHLVKMLLRAGVDVNAADSVSGFMQMQMWLNAGNNAKNRLHNLLAT